MNDWQLPPLLPMIWQLSSQTWHKANFQVYSKCYSNTLFHLWQQDSTWAYWEMQMRNPACDDEIRKAADRAGPVGSRWRELCSTNERGFHLHHFKAHQVLLLNKRMSLRTINCHITLHLSLRLAWNFCAYLKRYIIIKK